MPRKDGSSSRYRRMPPRIGFEGMLRRLVLLAVLENRRFDAERFIAWRFMCIS